MTFLPRFRRCAGLLLAACAAAAPFAAARADDGSIRLSLFGSDRIVGSGKVMSETRNLAGFQAIALRSSMKLVLRQGAREGIELRGDENILPLIETRVVDRGGVPTLEIGMKRGSSFSTHSEIVATIDLVTLRALSITGSGDVVGDVLKSPSLDVSISGTGNVRILQLAVDRISAEVSGSGDLEFGGRAGQLGITISGAGDVDARALEADEVSVRVAGRGDANVNARKTLTVSIAGVGNVKYSGDPVVKSSIAGHGSVSKQ
jgi:hypothetical protein